MKVDTACGQFDREQLEVNETAHETEDARVITSIWTLKATGEEVRRDVTVSILRGQIINGVLNNG